MKVILQYTDCMSDDKNIFGVLARNNVEVVFNLSTYYN